MSVAKRSAKRSRVHLDDSDKEADKASEPEEGKLRWPDTANYYINNTFIQGGPKKLDHF